MIGLGRRRRERGRSPSVALGVVLAGILLSVSPEALGAGAAFQPAFTTNGVSPPPAAAAGAAFDGADGYLVMFGGVNVDDSPLGTTWAFAHGNWTNLTGLVGAGPSPRWGVGMAYDAADGYLVLFGGCLNAACSVVANDTWEYAHDHWTNVTASQSTSPTGRGRTMMADDVRDGYLFLFGGTAATGTPLNDEWAFRGGRWAPTGNVSSPVPSPRDAAAFAYDPTTGSVILYGGSLATSPSVNSGDTWSYAGGNWTNLTSGLGAGPGPRRWAGMAFDTADGYLLLVNGWNSTYTGDSWTFSGSIWSKLPTHSGPIPSYAGLLAYDPADGYVVYFSGYVSGGLLTSTLVYSGGTWTLLINPLVREGFPLIDLLLLPAILWIVIGVAAYAGVRVRRRREALLSEGFLIPPGSPIQWVATAGPSIASMRRQRLVPLVALVVLLPFLLLLSFGGAAFFVGLIEIPLFAFLIGVMLWTSYAQTTVSIGIAADGIVVRRKRGELRVPWLQLQPGIMPPRRGAYYFRYAMPGHQAAAGTIVVTADQARAILSSPSAPRWVLVPGVSAALGVPSTATPPATPRISAGPPPADGAPRSPAPGSAASAPLPSTSYPAPRSPPPAAVFAAPRPGPPPAPPTRGPPPGTAACPRCGQPYPVGRLAFCPACGARLR